MISNIMKQIVAQPVCALVNISPVNLSEIFAKIKSIKSFSFQVVFYTAATFSTASFPLSFGLGRYNKKAAHRRPFECCIFTLINPDTKIVNVESLIQFFQRSTP